MAKKTEKTITKSLRTDLEESLAKRFDAIKLVLNLTTDSETVRFMIGIVENVLAGKPVLIPQKQDPSVSK